MLPSPMHEILDDVEGDRNEEDRDQACGQHAAEHSKAKEHPSVRAGAGRHHQREHAEDECERRHQDRTEPQVAAASAASAIDLPFILDLRELHDEDRILAPTVRSA